MPNLSDNALVVLKKRGYLLPKETPKQMFRRTAKLIASADKNYGATPAGLKKTEEDFYKIMSGLEYLSGSVLLNAGRKHKQFSACYVLPLSDSLEDIYDQLRNAALILRTGGGIGIPLTNLRPRGSLVESTGGISSGAVSFLRLFNYSAATISESSARRPALMGVLKIDHPDIEEFIKAKEDPSSLYHFNISVGSTDEFMNRVKRGRGKIHLFHPNDGLTEKDVNVMDLWNSIAEYAWRVGDPGMVFLDKMNKECPIPKLGKYETTNPCIVGSTKVSTEKGEISIAELVAKRLPVKVQTGNGNFESITGYWNRGEKEVFEIISEAGVSIKATIEHLFLTPQGFIELSQLKNGDKVIIFDKDSASPKIDRIISVKQAGIEQVYDLTIEPSHQLATNGIITHNCGEQPLLPYESCNLGNINLGRFVRAGASTVVSETTRRNFGLNPKLDSRLVQARATSSQADFQEKTMSRHALFQKQDTRSSADFFIDWKRLEEVVRLGVHFQDNVIDLCEYPIPQLQKMAKTTRKIGLGVMGWADMLIKLSIRYDSDEALKLAEKTAKFIQEAARDESVKLGKKRGSFPAFKDSIWKKKGFKTMRNSTVNTVAPTGTISIIAGCSSGIEPLFALVYRRENLLDLGKTSLLEVNQDFESQIAILLHCYIAKDQNNNQATIKQFNNLTMKKMLNEVSSSGSCQNIKELPKHIKDIFRVSMEIPYQWHIKMQAAWQKYTDAAVSKTINLPNSATVDDIKNAYLLAFETGCKGITVYRDGCRGEQVLNIGKSRRMTNDKSSPMTNEKCPECEAVMTMEEGCSTCHVCGFSKCMI